MYCNVHMLGDGYLYYDATNYKLYKATTDKHSLNTQMHKTPHYSILR